MIAKAREQWHLLAAHQDIDRVDLNQTNGINDAM
jgi:hypothetical protein